MPTKKLRGAYGLHNGIMKRDRPLGSRLFSSLSFSYRPYFFWLWLLVASVFSSCQQPGFGPFIRSNEIDNAIYFFEKLRTQIGSIILQKSSLSEYNSAKRVFLTFLIIQRGQAQCWWKKWIKRWQTILFHVAKSSNKYTVFLPSLQHLSKDDYVQCTWHFVGNVSTWGKALFKVYPLFVWRAYLIKKPNYMGPTVTARQPLASRQRQIRAPGDFSLSTERAVNIILKGRPISSGEKLFPVGGRATLNCRRKPLIKRNSPVGFCLEAYV